MKKRTRIVAIFMSILMLCTAFACPSLFQGNKTSTAEAALSVGNSCVVSLYSQRGYVKLYTDTSGTFSGSYLNDNTAYTYVGSVGNYYKIQYPVGYDTYRYVLKSHTRLCTISSSNYLKTNGACNLRTGPSTNYGSQGTSNSTTKYYIIGGACENFGMNKTYNWAQVVNISNHSIAWIRADLCSTFCVTSNGVVCDSSMYPCTYAQELSVSSYLRSGPGTNFAKQVSTAYPAGSTVYIDGLRINSSGEIWFHTEEINGDTSNAAIGFIRSTQFSN